MVVGDVTDGKLHHPDGGISFSRRLTHLRRRKRQWSDGYLHHLSRFDTLQITRDFATLNSGIRLDNYHAEYDSATACSGGGTGAITCPAGVAKVTGSSRRHRQVGQSGELEAGALLSPDGKRQSLPTHAFPAAAGRQQPPLRSLAAVTVPAADFKRKKPTPARLDLNGRFWINACYLPP